MKRNKLIIITGLIILYCFNLAGKDEKSTPKVTTEQGNITITGDKNSKGISYKLEKCLYLLTIKYKGNNSSLFDVISNKSEGKSSIIMVGGFAKESSGVCIESKTYESYLAEEDTVNVESDAEWSISFTKFPLNGEALNVPVNLKGSGTNITKVFNLKKGNTNFNIKCSDTKRGNFRVLLRDAKTGEKTVMKFLASNSKSLSEGKKDCFEKQNVQIPNDGHYFLEIIASGNADWEINIIQ